MHCTALNKRKPHGWTLIELLIVVVLLSVLFVAVYVRSPGNTLTLSAIINRLAYDVRYAQTLAMARGQAFYVTFDSSTSYTIRSASGSAAPGTEQTVLPGGYSLNTAGTEVAFDGKGIPYSDSALADVNKLASNVVVTVTGPNSASGTATITPLTGYVEIAL